MVLEHRRACAPCRDRAGAMHASGGLVDASRGADTPDELIEAPQPKWWCQPFRFSPVRSGSSTDPVSELESTLSELRGHPGVDHVILLGSDGLVVQHLGDGSGDEEGVAARIPGIEVACRSLGTAAARGSFTTAVIEYEMGVAIIVSLPGDLLLAVLVRSGVGFAPLLRDLRKGRHRLVELL